MNAKAARRAHRRQLRRTIRQQARTQRATSRIARRNAGSLVTHLLATGLTPKEARSAAGSMRKAADRLGVEGVKARVHAGRRMRTTTRYTPAQVAVIAMAYKPRKAAFKAARARLLAAVPATRRTTYSTAA